MEIIPIDANNERFQDACIFAMQLEGKILREHPRVAYLAEHGRTHKIRNKNRGRIEKYIFRELAALVRMAKKAEKNKTE